MNLNYKSVAFEVKAGGDGSTFEGYAAVFNNIDCYGDIISPGAFSKTIPDFLARGLILRNHGEAIGKPVDAREDPKGLFVKGVISDTAVGRDVKTLLKDGVVKKMSIGYMAAKGGSRKMTADETLKYWAEKSYSPSAEDIEAMEQATRFYGVRLLTAVELYEASPVDFPANRGADIISVKSIPKLSDIRRFTADAKLQLKAGRTLSQANRDRLQTMVDSLRTAVDDLDDLLDSTAPAEGEPDEDDQAAKSTLAVETAKLRLQLLRPTWN